MRFYRHKMRVNDSKRKLWNIFQNRIVETVKFKLFLLLFSYKSFVLHKNQYRFHITYLCYRMPAFRLSA